MIQALANGGKAICVRPSILLAGGDGDGSNLDPSV